MKKEYRNPKNKLIGLIWALGSIEALVIGIATWVFIGLSTVVAGPYAFGIFLGIAVSSSVGFGGIVGYCAKKALEYLT